MLPILYHIYSFSNTYLGIGNTVYEIYLVLIIFLSQSCVYIQHSPFPINKMTHSYSHHALRPLPEQMFLVFFHENKVAN